MSPAHVVEGGYRAEYWSAMARDVVEVYGDPEAGHSAEDDLLIEFVRALADGLVGDPRAAANDLCRIVLNRERTRWYS